MNDMLPSMVFRLLLRKRNAAMWKIETCAVSDIKLVHFEMICEGVPLQ